MTEEIMFENMTDDVINDIISRVCVQLEPELVQQLMMVFNYANYKYEKVINMNVLVISNYDCGEWWEIRENDRTYNSYGYSQGMTPEKFKAIAQELRKVYPDKSKMIIKDYDIIIYCDNGSSEILYRKRGK